MSASAVVPLPMSKPATEEQIAAAVKAEAGLMLVRASYRQALLAIANQASAAGMSWEEIVGALHAAADELPEGFTQCP